ncbi:MAG: hypothetical protein J5829_10150 [Lachnospiraceae bacterium]|nr:hypothetical protein [Lachnospiraceae bacterium]
MTIEAYTNPDFGWTEKLIFLIAAFVGMAICAAIILLRTGLASAGSSRDGRKVFYYTQAHNRLEKFFEMIIAGSSVMSFSCAYVIISHVYGLVAGGQGTPGPVLEVLINAWEGGRDFVLLLLICLSCVMNTILDKFIIPLRRISKEEKATIRMLAMFYVIIILLFLNHIGDESEYNPVMMYYLGLMVGRFVYFDASFGDFIEALKNMFKNLELLALGLALTGALCFFGFNKGYLLERNYYIVGAFYVHLFLLVVIFILKLSHIFDLIVRRPPGYDPRIFEKNREASYKEEAYDDGYYDDDEGYDDYAEDYDDGEYDDYEDDYDDDGYRDDIYEEDDGWTDKDPRR